MRPCPMPTARRTKKRSPRVQQSQSIKRLCPPPLRRVALPSPWIVLARHSSFLPEGGSQRSCSRGEEREKPVGVLPSGYFTRVSAQREEAGDLSCQEDIVPSDFTNPALLGDFLDWTVRDLSQSWDDGERTWFNMYVGLCLHEPWRWSTCHPRCFAACSVSRDRALAERFCCWACYTANGAKDVTKSSWPSMEAFTKHWYKSHCSDRTWQWQATSDELSVTPADLA